MVMLKMMSLGGLAQRMRRPSPKSAATGVKRINDEDARRIAGPSRRHLTKIVFQPKLAPQILARAARAGR